MSTEHAEFWSKVARKYDQVVDLQIGPRTRSLVRERLAKEQRLGDAVEFGCGTGFNTATLAEKAGRLVATDLSEGMLAAAQERVKQANVSFQIEDCQKTSLPENSFDTAFMSLLLHFTQPDLVLAEMKRILKPGGMLILVNLDPGALGGFDRVRCMIRVLFHGLTRYRRKPPKGFGDHVMTGAEICELLTRSGFEVLTSETIRDNSRSSYIPVEYIRATR
jgi:ABC-2 type transport system ATP-binding protein